MKSFIYSTIGKFSSKNSSEAKTNLLLEQDIIDSVNNCAEVLCKRRIDISSLKYIQHSQVTKVTQAIRNGFGSVNYLDCIAENNFIWSSMINILNDVDELIPKKLESALNDDNISLLPLYHQRLIGVLIIMIESFADTNIIVGMEIFEALCPILNRNFSFDDENLQNMVLLLRQIKLLLSCDVLNRFCTKISFPVDKSSNFIWQQLSTKSPPSALNNSDKSFLNFNDCNASSITELKDFTEAEDSTKAAINLGNGKVRDAVGRKMVKIGYESLKFCVLDRELNGEETESKSPVVLSDESLIENIRLSSNMLDSSAESADSPPFRLPKRHRQLSLNAEMKMANNKIPATISQNMGSEMFTSRRGVDLENSWDDEIDFGSSRVSRQKSHRSLARRSAAASQNSPVQTNVMDFDLNCSPESNDSKMTSNHKDYGKGNYNSPVISLRKGKSQLDKRNSPSLLSVTKVDHDDNTCLAPDSGLSKITENSTPMSVCSFEQFEETHKYELVAAALGNQSKTLITDFPGTAPIVCGQTSSNLSETVINKDINDTRLYDPELLLLDSRTSSDCDLEELNDPDHVPLIFGASEDLNSCNIEKINETTITPIVDAVIDKSNSIEKEDTPTVLSTKAIESPNPENEIYKTNEVNENILQSKGDQNTKWSKMLKKKARGMVEDIFRRKVIDEEKYGSDVKNMAFQPDNILARNSCDQNSRSQDSAEMLSNHHVKGNNSQNNEQSAAFERLKVSTLEKNFGTLGNTSQVADADADADADAAPINLVNSVESEITAPPNECINDLKSKEKKMNECSANHPKCVSSSDYVVGYNRQGKYACSDTQVHFVTANSDLKERILCNEKRTQTFPGKKADSADILCSKLESRFAACIAQKMGSDVEIQKCEINTFNIYTSHHSPFVFINTSALPVGPLPLKARLGVDYALNKKVM